MQKSPHDLRAELQRQGFRTLQMIPANLLECMAACIKRQVHYYLGAKAPLFAGIPPQFSKIDCSGFSKWALYIATSTGSIVGTSISQARGGCVIPDGSWNQNDWFRDNKFKWHDCNTGDREVDIKTYLDSASAMDGLVRIAFCRQEPGQTYGHVWFIYMGKTYESYGGHGPGCREIDSATLLRLVTDIYIVG